MARLLFANTTDGWEQLVKSLEANATDFPQFQEERAQLHALLEQARRLAAQQAALTASKQLMTRHILDLLAEGQKIATFMRAGVKHRYGTRNEKLVEFGMQPFRSKPRVKVVFQPQPAPTTPASSTEPI